MDTLRLVMFHALHMTLLGIGSGVPASLALTRLLRSQLFGVGPSDALTFGAVPLILLVVAVGSACIPAIRAPKVDFVVALRHE